MSNCITASDSLIESAIQILNQPDPWEKARLTNLIVAQWRMGNMAILPKDGKLIGAPDRPARSDDKVKVVAPGQTPKRGKGGSAASRQALLHSLCHIENWAVDLSWDVIARFGSRADYELPREFFDDFVTVAEDECRHFLLLDARLREVGSHYGALPAHDGLWESASHTSHSLPARLAVESCTHEARGLDVLPATIGKFRNNGDEASAKLLEGIIYPEEIGHCRAGVRWFRYLYDLAHSKYGSSAGSSDMPTISTKGVSVAVAAAAAQLECQLLDECAFAPSGAASSPSSQQTFCNQVHHVHQGIVTEKSAAPHVLPDWAKEALEFDTVEAWFHEVVTTHFWGNLKPPFNDEARAKAGFEKSWYLPLVEKTGRRRALADAIEVPA